MTREKVKLAERWGHLTIWRGQQTCPDCPDYLDEVPDAVVLLLKLNSKPY